MSESLIVILRFIIFYFLGCVFSTFLMIIQLDFYLEQYDIFCQKQKKKNTRFGRALDFACVSITWPLDIILTIYFKYFYNGGND